MPQSEYRIISMKRSEINFILQESISFLTERHFYLPPFAYWTPGKWVSVGKEAFEIVDRKLGWDITDFGSGDFSRNGLFLFTIRNGNMENLKTRKGKLYAEKIMIVGVDQVTPMHYHDMKTEDIINRGGGNLVLQLYNATLNNQLAETDVTISLDGVRHTCTAGDTVILRPGESITLPPYCYHKFWGAEAKVLVGEVSSVNDDDTDNYFYEPVGRFPEIEEDVPPLYFLVTDYDRLNLDKH